MRKDDGGVNFYSYSTEDEEGGRIGYISGDSDFESAVINKLQHTATN